MSERQLEPLINRLMHAVGKDGGPLSDAQLLERFVLARDEAAFESLLWRHGPMVLALCRRLLRHRHDAEDAFQAVFLVFFRKAHSIRRRECLASWLHKVAYRVALKARTGIARRIREDSSVASLPAPEQPDALIAADLREILDDALSRLPEKYRLPLLLHYLEGHTLQQVAQNIGCPPGTVSGRLHRARELLRRRLARRGVVLSTIALPAGLTQAGEAVPIPAALASAVLNAVRAQAGRAAAAGTVSAAALALAENASRLVPMARWQMAIVVLLMLGVVSLGIGLAARMTRSPDGVPSNVTATDAPMPPRENEARPSVAVSSDERLPPGARARLGSQRYTFGRTLGGLALSPDGATVAGVGQSSAVFLWDAATGKRKNMLQCLGGPVQICAVDFSPEGTGLLMGDGRGRTALATWQTPDEPAILMDGDHVGAVTAVRFTPDGQTVASAGADGVIRLCAARTGKVLHTLTGHQGTVHALVFAPDGKTLASAGEDKKIRLWDPASGALRQTLSRHNVPVRALSFSTDGKVLASAGRDGRIILSRPGQNWSWRGLNLSPLNALSLAFVDEKRLVIGSEAGVVVLFDLAADKMLHRYRGLIWPVEALACSRDGRWLIAGGPDGFFQRWEIDSGRADERDTPGHRGPVGGVDVSPDGQCAVSVGLDGDVRLWDLTSARALEARRPDWQTPNGPNYVSGLAFVLGGRAVVAGGGDGAIYFWDRANGTKTRWPAHPGGVTALARAPGGDRFFSAGHEGPVYLWDALSGTKVRTYEAVPEMRHLVVSPDGERLAGATKDGKVHVWELATGKLLNAATDLIPADGLKVPGNVDVSLRRWRPPSGVSLLPGKPLTENGLVIGLAFAPDGTLALGIARQQQTSPLPGTLAFAPDGRLALALVSDISLVDPNTGAEVARFAGHATQINALAFTPDGKTLLSTSDDGTILIWNVPPQTRNSKHGTR